MRIDPEHFYERSEILKLHDKQPAFFKLGKTAETKDWVQIENAAISNPYSANVTQKVQIHKETLKELLKKIEPKKETFYDLYQRLDSMSLDEQEKLLKTIEDSEEKSFFCFVFAYFQLKHKVD